MYQSLPGVYVAPHHESNRKYSCNTPKFVVVSLRTKSGYLRTPKKFVTFWEKQRHMSPYAAKRHSCEHVAECAINP